MPSSSTRFTSVELKLAHFYRQAFSRLWACNWTDCAYYITNQFADILDINKSDLQSALKPSYHPDIHTVESYKVNLKQWQDLETTNARMRPSGTICNAGNALADAGAVLFKVGRDMEATRLCDLGNWLWQVSINEYNAEESGENQGYDEDWEMA